MVFRTERFGIALKKEKKSYWKQFGIVVLMVVVVISITLAVQGLIKNNIMCLEVTDDLNATWISSLASYWGGILGGVISGMLAMVGVVWTIRYYKTSDAAKTRIAHMPFLKMVVKNTAEQMKDFNIKGRTRTYSIRLREKSVGLKKEEYKTLYVKMNMQNIGQGFASTLVVFTGETMVALSYVDCMTNEYIQEYNICFVDGKIDKIDSGYPYFMGQTHDIGNEVYKERQTIRFVAEKEKE